VEEEAKKSGRLGKHERAFAKAKGKGAGRGEGGRGVEISHAAKAKGRWGDRYVSLFLSSILFWGGWKRS